MAQHQHRGRALREAAERPCAAACRRRRARSRRPGRQPRPVAIASCSRRPRRRSERSTLSAMCAAAAQTQPPAQAWSLQRRRWSARKASWATSSARARSPRTRAAIADDACVFGAKDAIERRVGRAGDGRRDTHAPDSLSIHTHTAPPTAHPVTPRRRGCRRNLRGCCHSMERRPGGCRRRRASPAGEGDGCDSQPIRGHRQAAVPTTVDDYLERLAGRRRQAGDEDGRQEMIRGGHREW